MTSTVSLGAASWLNADKIGRLLTVLDRDGEEARVVGGAVRNALLHMPIDEIDIATTAVPDIVIRRVTAAGFKAVPTGIAHGTVTVVVDGQPFEVTTLREDVETYGRKAKVVFGRDWQRDAVRRDFTINALSVSRDGQVYDYVGGAADLTARRVRFIGDADTRISEDFLRILRFFRFHAYFGEGSPDAAGLAACIRARRGLETLSRERVRTEILKLLLASHAIPTVDIMAECGILGPAIGGVPRLASFANLVKVEAASGVAPDALRRLGALAVWVREDGKRLGQKFRLANAETERLIALDGWWRVVPQADDATAHALLYHIGAQSFTDRVLLAWARSPSAGTDAGWRRLATLPRQWSAPKFPLAATDFIRRGVSPGPNLGAVLRAAESIWIAADFPATPEAIEAIADQAVQTAATSTKQ